MWFLIKCSWILDDCFWIYFYGLELPWATPVWAAKKVWPDEPVFCWAVAKEEIPPGGGLLKLPGWTLGTAEFMTARMDEWTNLKKKNVIWCNETLLFCQMNSLTVLRSWFSRDHRDGEYKEDEREYLVAKCKSSNLNLKRHFKMRFVPSWLSLWNELKQSGLLIGWIANA